MTLPDKGYRIAVSADAPTKEEALKLFRAHLANLESRDFIETRYGGGGGGGCNSFGVTCGPIPPTMEDRVRALEAAAK